MIGNADLAAKRNKIAQIHAAGDAHMPGDDAMLANMAIVSDLDQIVDFGAGADDRIGQRAAVDGGAGADFHVVLQDGAAQLRDFFVTGGGGDIAEAVTADDRAAMEDDAVADQGVGDHAIGADAAVAADLHARFDDGVGFDVDIVADGYLSANDNAGFDAAALAQGGRRVDYCAGMRAGCYVRRVQMPRDFSEGLFGIGDGEQYDVFGNCVGDGFDKASRGFGVQKSGFVFYAGVETNVARLRLVEGGDVANFHLVGRRRC